MLNDQFSIVPSACAPSYPGVTVYREATSPGLFWRGDCFHELIMYRDKAELVRIIEIKLKRIVDWLTNSGMKVNESKTELCLFHRGDSGPITVNINGNEVISKKSINILCMIFDSKLQWSEHIAHSIKRSMNPLNAICLIRHYFKKDELLKLITSPIKKMLCTLIIRE